jgi:hypothetical protein
MGLLCMKFAFPATIYISDYRQAEIRPYQLDFTTTLRIKNRMMTNATSDDIQMIIINPISSMHQVITTANDFFS